MIRFIKLLLVAAIIAAITVAGVWYFNSIKGDGVSKTEDRAVSDFSKIMVSGAYKVQWSQGKPMLSISTDENLLPHIRTTVSGSTLQIDSKENLIPTKPITLILSSGSLADVQLTGANTFRAEKVSAPDLKLKSTGASTISVDGSAAKLTVSLTGASTLHAKSFEAQTATLSLTGASHADLTVMDTLKASITGAGSVNYSGNPKAVEQHVTGAGNIKHQP